MEKKLGEAWGSCPANSAGGSAPLQKAQSRAETGVLAGEGEPVVVVVGWGFGGCLQCLWVEFGLWVLGSSAPELLVGWGRSTARERCLSLS